ncbi:MAG: hypothetical protein HC804_15070 [Anaerolineae bacterium]|nr:hypothetical protein [Anaerolineae bacterium]
MGATQLREGLSIDPTDRQAAIDFYLSYYLPTQNVTLDWSGNFEECKAGEISAAFRNAVLQRINYFRAMAGVPADIVFNAAYNQKAQAAALMISVNKQADHFPPQHWRCYSADGSEAARHANLYPSVRSPEAIDGYFLDPGAGNYAVIHRRWLLYPQTREMGTGDVPKEGDYAAANALWVVDDNHYFDNRPPTRNDFVAWPPPGFVPNLFTTGRWSFSYPNAGFEHAAVTMTLNGQALAVQVSPLVKGYGENTLVWEVAPAVISSLSAADSVFAVHISNVIIGSQAKDFDYSVTAFQPPVFDQESLTNHVYIPLISN